MARLTSPPALTLLLIFSFLLPGCATHPFTPITHHRTELFFGTLKADGSTVSASEFQRFIETEVTPRFPDGFTVVNGHGWWRTAGGVTTREDSKILLILHDRSATPQIQAIRDRYKQRFQQESVLEVTTPVKASF